MGGMAAMHAALDFPESFGALGLVATTAGGSGLTLPSDAYLAAAVARYEPGQDEPIDALELAVGPRFRSEYRTLYEAFSKEAVTQPRTVGPEELAQVLFSHDVSQRLGEIAVPTVVICGTEDQVHPLPNSLFLARQIAAARLVELEGAGHLLNVEASERLIDEIFALVGLV
jgi:pimeloyl-ACP methyl ester carboxylesterase